MAERGSPRAPSTTNDADEADPSAMTNDMTPSEQQQFIATLSKVNANVKLQLFYSEKRVEDLTAALGVDENQVRNFRTVEKRNVEQSVTIEALASELKERDDIIAACSKHIDELETKCREGSFSSADEAVALATSVAAATAESVLRELEHAQLDNGTLMTRAAAAETALVALRETTVALEADVAAHRSQSAANLRRSILAVASTQAAEQKIQNLTQKLNTASCAADEAGADREVALAREHAVREELAARERIAAGSLETKVNELMLAESSRREEHARVLTEVRADVERARAEVDTERRRAEAAKSNRRQAMDELHLLRDRCEREMAECRASAERALNDNNTRARILIEEARERAHRAEHATTSGADEAVTRARQDAADARAKAEEEIKMVKRRFELDLAGARQRAEKDSEEARRAAFEARDAHAREGEARIVAAVAAKENAESIARSLKAELVDARSASAETEMALAAARAREAAAEPVAEMPSPTTALNRAYADSAEAQMARLMATARDAEATREEAITELETVTRALVEERNRCDAAKADAERARSTLAETERALLATEATLKETKEAHTLVQAPDSARRETPPESTARAPRFGPSPSVAPANASVKTKAMWFQMRHAPGFVDDFADSEGDDDDALVTTPSRGARHETRDDVAATAAAAAAAAQLGRENDALRCRVANLESRAALAAAAARTSEEFAESKASSRENAVREESDQVVDALQSRVDELEVKLRLADFASRSNKREATEMATRRERDAAKSRTPPASPTRTPGASPAVTPPRSPAKSLLAMLTLSEDTSGDASRDFETAELRARVAMLECDVAARDRRVETAETDVCRATKAVQDMSVRAEKRTKERREAAAAEIAASGAAVAASRDENVTLRRRVVELETRVASGTAASTSETSLVVSLEKDLADRTTRLALAQSDLRQATASMAEMTERVSERDARARVARVARENELVAQLQASKTHMKRTADAALAREGGLRVELAEVKQREAHALAHLQALEASIATVTPPPLASPASPPRALPFGTPVGRTPATENPLRTNITPNHDDPESPAVLKFEAHTPPPTAPASTYHTAAVVQAYPGSGGETALLEDSLADARQESAGLRVELENLARRTADETTARADAAQTRVRLAETRAASAELRAARLESTQSAVLKSALETQREKARRETETERDDFKRRLSDAERRLFEADTRVVDMQNSLEEANGRLARAEAPNAEAPKREAPPARRSNSLDKNSRHAEVLSALEADLADAEARVELLIVTHAASTVETKARASAEEKRFRARIVDAEDAVAAAVLEKNTAVDAAALEQRLREQHAKAKRILSEENVALKARLSEAEDKIADFGRAETAHRVALTRAEARARASLDEAMRATEASEAELHTLVHQTKERAAREKAVMRTRVDEAEAARDAAETKLASGDATRAAWVATETAKADAFARDAEARSSAAESVANQSFAAAEASWRAKLDEARVEATAATSALETRLALAEDTARARAEADANAELERLRTQMSDLRSRALSEKARLETKAFELEEGLCAQEAQWRARVSETRAKANDADAELRAKLAAAEETLAAERTVARKAKDAETSLRRELEEARFLRANDSRGTQFEEALRSLREKLAAALENASVSGNGFVKALATASATESKLRAQIVALEIAADDAMDAANTATEDADAMHRDALGSSRAHDTEMAEMQTRLDAATKDAEDAALGTTVKSGTAQDGENTIVATKDGENTNVEAKGAALVSLESLLQTSRDRETALLGKLTAANVPPKTPSPEKHVKRLQLELESVCETVAALRDTIATKPPESSATATTLAGLLESAARRETQLRTEQTQLLVRVAELERDSGEARFALAAARAPAEPGTATAALAAALEASGAREGAALAKLSAAESRASSFAIDAAAATAASEAVVNAHADAQTESATRESRLEGRLAFAESRAAELAAVFEKTREEFHAAVAAKKDLETALLAARRQSQDLQAKLSFTTEELKETTQRALGQAAASQTRIKTAEGDLVYFKAGAKMAAAEKQKALEAAEQEVDTERRVAEMQRARAEAAEMSIAGAVAKAVDDASAAAAAAQSDAVANAVALASASFRAERDAAVAAAAETAAEHEAQAMARFAEMEQMLDAKQGDISTAQREVAAAAERETALRFELDEVISHVASLEAAARESQTAAMRAASALYDATSRAETAQLALDVAADREDELRALLHHTPRREDVVAEGRPVADLTPSAVDAAPQPMVTETLAAALEAAGIREGQLGQQLGDLKNELAAATAAVDDAAATHADERAESAAREALTEGRLRNAEARVVDLADALDLARGEARAAFAAKTDDETACKAAHTLTAETEARFGFSVTRAREAEARALGREATWKTRVQTLEGDLVYFKAGAKMASVEAIKSLEAGETALEEERNKLKVATARAETAETALLDARSAVAAANETIAGCRETASTAETRLRVAADEAVAVAAAASSGIEQGLRAELAVASASRLESHSHLAALQEDLDAARDAAARSAMSADDASRRAEAAAAELAAVFESKASHPEFITSLETNTQLERQIARLELELSIAQAAASEAAVVAETATAEAERRAEETTRAVVADAEMKRAIAESAARGAIEETACAKAALLVAENRASAAESVAAHAVSSSAAANETVAKARFERAAAARSAAEAKKNADVATARAAAARLAEQTAKACAVSADQEAASALARAHIAEARAKACLSRVQREQLRACAAETETEKLRARALECEAETAFAREARREAIDLADASRKERMDADAREESLRATFRAAKSALTGGSTSGGKPVTMNPLGVSKPSAPKKNTEAEAPFGLGDAWEAVPRPIGTLPPPLTPLEDSDDDDDDDDDAYRHSDVTGGTAGTGDAEAKTEAKTARVAKGPTGRPPLRPKTRNY
tara:strand:+ start:1370 stop:10126 length:8757 start_codon:yes stop_codon:yes gene_type:complete